ncbi:energy transducer TonB [Tenacibaculum sp. SG-28]|uniref:energy transducer TonB n=1 Tax=Tenacibaculum sp. SG-28 TaxID=754426 RepID=UPI000CF370AC|nr:energy transducer TonB [Tenacibaculum sp. SG-28]PQJ21943.1 hypothetical protein BSU00_07965 [Tenacibaculum sp. SG-28]
MKKVKKYPKNQLEKFSTLFTQLGLVLVLLVVYLVLEYETVPKKAIAYSNTSVLEEVYSIPTPVVLKKLPKKVVQEQKVPKKMLPKVVPLDQFDSTKEENLLQEPLPLSTEVEGLLEHPEPEIIDADDDPEPVLLMHLQKAPIFPGCEGLTEAQARECLERKIKAHVRHYFDAAIAQEVGMSSGTYRILTQFVIDNNGEITDLQIRAPHAKLKKEATKVVDKLPKFTPGMQNDKPVKVRYSLPITFRVE